MKSILLFVLPLLVLANHAQAEQTDEQQIISNIHAMWKAVETDNLKAYLKHIHPDYTVFGEGDAYLHKGKDKEAIDYADYLQRSEGVRTFMHQPEVTVRGDTAWITYYWNDAGYISGKRFTSRGKSTRIFVKSNGQWLCIHSHFTELP
jgi:ketosteroid isomerase-like protein